MNESLFNVTPISEIKAELRKYGYKFNTAMKRGGGSKRVVYNFKAHFNPKMLSEEMDLESFAILKALNKKYK